MRNVSPFLMFFLFAASAAGAADVNVLALTAGKAVLVIDGGKPRTLTAGQTSPEKVKLISATSEEAVIEIGGKRRTLGLGQSIFVGEHSSAAQRVSLTSDARGHFFTTAAINGVSMKFLVDTGASAVTISSAQAKRAGILYLSGPKGLLQTANGLTPAYRVKFTTVSLGEITLHNVDGVVVEGDALGGAGLLGLSFLNRTVMRREGDTMTLTRRY
ncbi:MAG: clan AA aspartic protease [Betaproteobacteria bacterium]|nr:clan AA aspartic protease [Betaproteobacteria bacterium]